MISVDTSLEWIERTRSNLALLGITATVDFRAFGSILNDRQYDLVFVDGVDELRLPFAIFSWSALVPGGHLMFHDTHRDFLYVTNLASMSMSDVESLAINCNQSNISVVKKRLRPIESLLAFPSFGMLTDLARTFNSATKIAVWGQCDLAARFGEQIGATVGTIRKRLEGTQAEDSHPGHLCDLIVIDELNERMLFTLPEVWTQLRNGGYLLLKDRSPLWNTMQVAVRYWLEVDSVHPNWDQSEYSLIRKKAAEPYVNWNDVERRTAWEIGHCEPDNEAIKSRLKCQSAE